MRATFLPSAKHVVRVTKRRPRRKRRLGIFALPFCDWCLLRVYSLSVETFAFAQEDMRGMRAAMASARSQLMAARREEER
eukprot:1154914-Prorocentrum_minimum.AAC.1